MCGRLSGSWRSPWCDCPTRWTNSVEHCCPRDRRCNRLRRVREPMAKVTREDGELAPTKKKKDDEVVGGFVMPAAKHKPMSHVWDYILLLFGEKKIGKTSMLAENADNTFFFMFEPGDKALEVYSHLFTRWPDFKVAVKAFIKDPRFKVGVIDTVDLAYKMAESYAL